MNTVYFAKNIKKYRMDAGLTQMELARILSISPQTISKWEKGQALPGLDTLCKLSDVLHVTPDRLLAQDTEYYIGIDGGGTKTAFGLMDSTGKLKQYLVLGGSNPNIYGMQNAIRTIQEGIEVLSANGSVKHIFAGMAGAVSGGNQEVLQKAMNDAYPSIPVEIGSDIENVRYSILGVRHCVTAICGTGCVIYAEDETGFHRLGGYGYLFEGAGSGYDIGRDVLTHCFEVEDGLAPASLLSEKVRRETGAPLFSVIDKFYREGSSTVAGFARFAFLAEGEGDPTAREILKRNIKKLGEKIRYAQDTFHCGNEVIVSGGIAENWKAFPAYLIPLLRPDTVLHIPSLPPLFGACVRSLGEANIADPTSFRDNFEKSYAEICHD